MCSYSITAYKYTYAHSLCIFHIFPGIEKISTIRLKELTNISLLENGMDTYSHKSRKFRFL